MKSIKEIADLVLENLKLKQPTKIANLEAPPYCEFKPNKDETIHTS